MAEKVRSVVYDPERCPVCGAARDEPCTTKSGRKARAKHLGSRKIVRIDTSVAKRKLRVWMAYEHGEVREAEFEFDEPLPMPRDAQECLAQLRAMGLPEFLLDDIERAAGDGSSSFVIRELGGGEIR